MTSTTVMINDREVSLSNLDKNLYPSFGYAKSRILEYYTQIAPFMLPFLKDRALTLQRYPQGVEENFFYEKHCPKYHPKWDETAMVGLDVRNSITYCLVNNLETLLWVGNLGSIELHVPMAKANAPDNPDAMVFDLDPGDGVDTLDCARVAFIIRDLLSDMNLDSFVKTSGKKGLHVFVPLDPAKTRFEQTRYFSRAVASIMQKSYPDLVTDRENKELRKGKVFINWSQNDVSRTMVCVYSLRAAEKPWVSFPLSWKDLKIAVKRSDLSKLQVLAPDAVKWADKKGDFYHEIMGMKQRLPNAESPSRKLPRRSATRNDTQRTNSSLDEVISQQEGSNEINAQGI